MDWISEKRRNGSVWTHGAVQLLSNDRTALALRNRPRLRTRVSKSASSRRSLPTVARTLTCRSERLDGLRRLIKLLAHLVRRATAILGLSTDEDRLSTGLRSVVVRPSLLNGDAREVSSSESEKGGPVGREGAHSHAEKPGLPPWSRQP